MPVLLLRHAIAVPREGWSSHDDQRPLTDRGRRQAEALVDEASYFSPSRLLSSPSVRCVDTVRPLAEARRLVIECTSDLAEGKALQAAALVRSLLEVEGDVVLCTHGDVVGDVLAALEKDGARLEGDDCQKGSIWVVERDAGCIRGRYLPPPA